MNQAAPGSKGETYFFMMALLLLAINIAGFSNFAVQLPAQRPPFTLWLNLHAATSFGWLLLLVTQNALIRSSNIPLHRKLGQWGGVIAAGLVISGAIVAIQAIQRTGNLDNASFQVVNLINFCILVGLGLAARKRSNQHKRFMLIATIAILPPSVARLAMSVGLPEATIPITLLSLLLSMILYDLIRLRRVKWATAIGSGLTVSGIALSLFLNSTAWWGDFLAQALL